MPIPTDPLLSTQWHLINTTPGLLDLNVAGVWNPTEGPAYTGAGIWTVVIDDGFDYLHSDLAPNYHQDLDYDFDGANDLDPFGLDSDAHGTAVMGIIGAAANGSGVVGIAYDTELIGYRVEGLITDAWLASIAEAISNAAVSALGDVVNISQGIANDEFSEFGFGYTASLFDDIETAIGTAVNTGRDGLGTIIVKSAGNSRADVYDVNSDDWTNDTRQVVVAAVDQNGFVSDYSSYGAAILVSAFGTPGEVVTTDRSSAAGYDLGDFTSSFNGTSSAAPMVSGVVGLMLDANSSLGWRDVQSILANTARHVGTDVGGVRSGFELFDWGFNAASTWNGGGLHFSNDYGYGLVDALAAVRLSETWLFGNQAAQISGNQFSNTIDILSVATVIPDGNLTGITFSGSAGFDDFVERVTVSITFSTTFMGDVDIYVTSPDGTVSILSQDQAGGMDFNGTWVFETQAFRGEGATGTWSVRIVDDAAGDVLTVTDIVLTTQGNASQSDRYVYTNEYSDYAGLFGHVNNVTDSNGGSNDVANASAVSTASTIRLDGVAGAIDGVMTTFTGIEHAVGGDGGDTIIGSTGGNMLYGMRGADLINGLAGDDSVEGGTGNDTLIGGLHADTLNGGDGIDFAAYWTATVGVTVDMINSAINTGEAVGDVFVSIEHLAGSNHADDLRGDNAANIINGYDGNDVINGRNGNDTLGGNLGNDTLIGGQGADNLQGGAGVNMAAYWTSLVGLTVDMLNLAANTGDAAGDTYSLITQLAGSNFNDNIRADNAANLLFGLDGNDDLNGRNGNDTLNGGNGNDTLTGGQGADSLLGGAGINLASYASALAGLTLDMGNMAANTGDALGDTFSLITDVTGSTFNDILRGDNANNLLAGIAGNDEINGRNGNDTLNGGDGNDTLIGGQGADRLVGAAGINMAAYWTATAGLTVDLLNYSFNTGDAAGDFMLHIRDLAGSNFADTIRGDLAGNGLFGFDGNDTLIGRDGNDTLHGGQGNDSLFGQTGADQLTGGGGLDSFVFNTVLGGGQVDHITDFSSVNDTFVLENGIFTALANGALAGAAFGLGGAATTAAQRIIYNQATGQLFYDTDGTGGAAQTLFATVVAGTVVNVTDFLIV